MCACASSVPPQLEHPVFATRRHAGAVCAPVYCKHLVGMARQVDHHLAAAHIPDLTAAHAIRQQQHQQQQHVTSVQQRRLLPSPSHGCRRQSAVDCRAARTAPVPSSARTLSVLSLLPLTNRRLSLLHATWKTGPTWLRKVATKLPLSPSHNLIDLSKDADSTQRPSGLNATCNAALHAVRGIHCM